MRILFVTWWPAGHFEFDWHLTGKEVERLASEGVEVARIAGDSFHPPATPLRLLARAKFLWRLVHQAGKSDVLLGYMDSPSTRAVAICKRLGLLRRPYFVITDFWLAPPSGTSLRQAVKRLFLRHIYGRAEMVVFDTEPGMREYTDRMLLGPGPTVTFIRSAAMAAKIEWLASMTKHHAPLVNPGKRYFFAIGKTYREFDTVLAAANELPNSDFVIMTTADLGPLPANVIQAPWGAYEDYLDILMRCQAMIVPLRAGAEAAGIRSLYEAWALRVPAIVAANRGISAYLGQPYERAAPYRPGDSGSLASAIRKVLSEPETVSGMVQRAFAAVTDGDLSSSAYLRQLFQLVGPRVGLASRDAVRASSVDSLRGAD